MLMAVNVGNSCISVGFFADDACELHAQFQIATDLRKTSDEYLCLIRSIVREEGLSVNAITGAILSSVVPQLTNTVSEALLRLTGIRPLVVGPGVKTGFPIKIDSPSELGGDMVANTAAVLRKVGRKAAIIADLGTVTTISAINRNGEYVGCCIAPGVGISFESLHGKTAQLPNVMLSDAGKAIGKNSQDAVLSGVILGHAMMLDGFVARFAKELKCQPEELSLVMTGEYATMVASSCRRSFELDSELTLKGLFILYHNTVQNAEL